MTVSQDPVTTFETTNTEFFMKLDVSLKELCSSKTREFFYTLLNLILAFALKIFLARIIYLS